MKFQLISVIRIRHAYLKKTALSQVLISFTHLRKIDDKPYL